MATCPRGFLFVRNMRTGDIVPFFIRVREEDIIWTSDVSALTTEAGYVENDNTWDYEVDTTYNRIKMFKGINVSDLTYISTRKATFNINLPTFVNIARSGAFITKKSNDISVIENSMVEAKFINANESGLSNTLQVTFISINGEFTSSNVINLDFNLDVLIHGFTV